VLLLDFVELPLFPFPPPGAAPSTPAVEAVTVALKAAGAAAVKEVSFTLDPAPAGAAGGAEGVDVEGGVGDTDLALDGIKGTEAGFKFDLMLLLDDAIAEVAVEDLDEAEGIGLSFSLCNAWVAAECLAA
jgi:hypothetical protein